MGVSAQGYSRKKGAMLWGGGGGVAAGGVSSSTVESGDWREHDREISLSVKDSVTQKNVCICNHLHIYSYSICFR